MIEPTRATSPVKPGDTVPAFSLTGLDGRTRDVPARPALGHALLAFFKVSCPTCRLTFPFLARYHHRFAAPEAAFLGVSQDEAEAAAAFALEHGTEFPVLVDAPDLAMSRAYAIRIVPTLVLLRPDGEVAFVAEGFVRSELEELAALLGDLLGKSGAPVWRPGEDVPARRPG